LSKAEAITYVVTLTRNMQMPTIVDAPIPPISDPNDIHVVQAAICAKADYLCTLDRHFFEAPVVAYCADRGVTVISDVELLKKLRQ
jgi:predicted nucleic acid-binding protein